MTGDEEVVEFIIKKYGPVLDLRENPGSIIDIIRTFAPAAAPDGGTPCGGTPLPAPAPSPSAAQGGDDVTLSEVLRQLLTLSRDVSLIKERLDVKG
ncbi:MAG TPA: hypothetical protein VGB14_04725 [Acidimicrobiales bacterium]|jgi:hypothetical protein